MIQVSRSTTVLAMFSLLLGCATSKQPITTNPQPELFHPRTQIAKRNLDQLVAGGITIFGPTEGLVAGHPYEIVITDLTAPATKGAQTSVTFQPADIATAVTPGPNQLNQVIWKINPEKLAGIERFEVTAVARAASGLPYSQAIVGGLVARQTFPVLPEPDDQPNIVIQGPSIPIHAGQAGKYQVTISDLTGGDLKNTRVTVFPGGVATRNDKATGEAGGLVYEIDGEKIVGVDAVEFLVIGASAVGKTLAAATIDGSVARQKFEVVGADRFIATTLNVMSYEDTANEFGRFFANTFYAADVQFTNTSDSSLLLYGASLRSTVRYLMSKSDVEKVFGPAALAHPELLDTMVDSNGKVIDYADFSENRRPMSFSDVLAVFDYRRRGQPKQRAIDALKFVGALATGASVFVSGTDYANGVALFTGILTPELEKLILWDILLHIRNLEARSLKEVEEIPAYGQIHRVVYFPRRAIYGILPMVPVYISEIYHTSDDGGMVVADAVAVSKLGNDPAQREAAVKKILARAVVDNPEVLRDILTSYTNSLQTVQRLQDLSVDSVRFPTVVQGDSDKTYAAQPGIVSIIGKEIYIVGNGKAPGADAKIETEFKPELAEAVKKFQSGANLPATGKVDWATRVALFNAAAAKLGAPPSITDAQKKLSELGYSVAATGQDDPQTKVAVRAFQTAHPILSADPADIDGAIGPRTWLALTVEGHLAKRN